MVGSVSDDQGAQCQSVGSSCYQGDGTLRAGRVGGGHLADESGVRREPGARSETTDGSSTTLTSSSQPSPLIAHFSSSGDAPP